MEILGSPDQSLIDLAQSKLKADCPCCGGAIEFRCKYQYNFVTAREMQEQGDDPDFIAEHPDGYESEAIRWGYRCRNCDLYDELSSSVLQFTEPNIDRIVEFVNKCLLESFAYAQTS